MGRSSFPQVVPTLSQLMAGIIGQFIRRSKRITGPTCLHRLGNQAAALLTRKAGALEDMEPPVVVSLEPDPLLLSSDEAGVQTSMIG